MIYYTGELYLILLSCFLWKSSLYSLILPSISFSPSALFQTEGEGNVSSFIYLSFTGCHEQHYTNKTYCDTSLISKKTKFLHKGTIIFWRSAIHFLESDIYFSVKDIQFSLGDKIYRSRCIVAATIQVVKSNNRFYKSSGRRWINII